MTSIRQNQEPPRLPDFCNLGVWLRVLLGVNLLAALAAAAACRTIAELPEELSRLAVFVEPPLIASLMLLCLVNRPVLRSGYAAGAAAVVAIALATTAGIHLVLTPFAADVAAPASLAAALFWAALAAAALLCYFAIRARLQSPALAEARLMALTARIRPHFLFNALNAVLGVIRSDPRRAEQALEELADLFRVLMRENRDLVPLSEEIALARKYLDLERLRLGDRLQVKWDIESCPPDALVPPLMLQPLLENAVYHGIEPAGEPAEITIGFSRRGDQLLIELVNPYAAGASEHAGNQMALANIRERLMLFFDLEARLETTAGDGRFLVRMLMPYRAGPAP
ncbi:MAG TPA: histidine kinase [Rhodocyclaceae bacterium]|nr:histidine kinase [Rhodocyclaceae bacterium]